MFSKNVYKNQNGKVYYILSIITFICFVYGISVIVRSIFNIPLLFELGDFAIVMGFVCIIGIIGFPLVLALNKGMKNFNGVCLFSSYDYELINSVATRIIEFKEDGKYIDKMCTYDEYLNRQ